MELTQLNSEELFQAIARSRRLREESQAVRVELKKLIEESHKLNEQIGRLLDKEKHLLEEISANLVSTSPESSPILDYRGPALPYSSFDEERPPS
jgi:uncharacterized protein (DUF3084 family)